MKIIIAIGATGIVGRAALTGLTSHKVITATLSGKGADYQVDITSRASLKKLFEAVGEFDAVINTSGHCEFAPFETMTDEQWETSIQNKFIGQVRLVNVGIQYIRDGGSFTLISGINNYKPVPHSIASSTTSGAVDTFVKCVAFELPRGIRINGVNPTMLASCYEQYHEMLPGFEPVADKLVGKAFQRSVDGFITGQVLFVDA